MNRGIRMTWECTWVENHIPPLTTFMDNFFSSPRLFDYLDRRKINSCGTVRPNRRDIPSDFGPKLKLKRGDVRVRTRGGLTALVWKDSEKFTCWLTWTHHHQQKEISVTIATAMWNVTSWNGTAGTWVTLTILIVWVTAVQWVDVPSSGPQNYFSTFWI